jgi:hypothetical protein
MEVANTVAHYDTTTNTTVKSFIVLASGLIFTSKVRLTTYKEPLIALN